jgi:hypothetical protein
VTPTSLRTNVAEGTTGQLAETNTAHGAINELTAAFLTGTGTPQGVVPAPVGTLFLRTDGGAGTTLYIKESGGSGNTGWVAK